MKKLPDIGFGNDVLDSTPKCSGNETKYRQAEPYPTQKLLHTKVKNQWSKMTTYIIGEIFANHPSDVGLLL